MVVSEDVLNAHSIDGCLERIIRYESYHLATSKAPSYQEFTSGRTTVGIRTLMVTVMRRSS